MLNSGFAKDNINAKINTKINKWLTFDFNARLSYQKVKGTGSGADDNQSSATTSVNARSVVFAPVEKLISGGSDDDENVNNARYTPIEILNATYKRVSRFQQNYNAGVNWEPVKGLKFRSQNSDMDGNTIILTKYGEWKLQTTVNTEIRECPKRY